MPFILGICGFEAQNTTRDRITISAGSPLYSTTNLPSGTGSLAAIRGSSISIRVPWYDDGNAGVFEPSGDEFWFHGRYYNNNSSNASNDALRLGVGSSGTEFITVSSEDNTNLITIRVAGVVRATASLAVWSLATWHRVHIHVEGTSSGDDVHVYLNGNLSSPVVSYTLTGTDASNLAAVGTGKPNQFYFVAMPNGSESVDDLVAWDPTDPAARPVAQMLELYLDTRRPTGNGAEQDWTGGYTAIDEVPNSDADKITSTAVDDYSTFTFAASSADNVIAVKVLARVTRTGTDAGANIGLLAINGAGTSEEGAIPAPGDGDVTVVFQQGPGTTDWTTTDFNATRFGVRSRT